MRVYTLNADERAATGFTHRVRITEADLTETTANTAQTIAIFTVKARDYVQDVAFNLVTPFENTADNAYNTTTVIVGDGGDTARYIASAELNANGSKIIAGPAVNSKVHYAYTADDTIDAIFGSMAAKSLVNLNAGALDIFLKVTRLPDYAGA